VAKEHEADGDHCDFQSEDTQEADRSPHVRTRPDMMLRRTIDSLLELLGWGSVDGGAITLKADAEA
jgi:hypothetical protein